MEPSHIQEASNTILPLVTGPAAAVVVCVVALWKLWARIDKMIDALQILVKDNTRAMENMCQRADAMSAKIDQGVEKLDRLANGLGSREHTDPGRAAKAG